MTSLTLILAILPIAASGAALDPQTALRVDADFPGGNIIFERIEGDVVCVRQDVRDTAGNWFYWCFRVRGAAGRTLTFRFTKGHAIGARGPAVSLDGGRTWAWLGADAVTVRAPAGAKWVEQDASFRHTFSAGADDVRFCMTIPYLEFHLKEFLAKHAKNPALTVETLCKSQQGRDVELLRVGRGDGSPDHRVLLTARHHACEAIANYVMEGILDTALAPGEDGEWFRRHVEIMAVPFMDKDGVEDGDQGKNRRPHDHNRDYLQEIYPSVKSLKEKAPAWSGGKLRIAIDLHCPWLRGGINETIYIAGGSARVAEFTKILEAVQQGPLPFKDRRPDARDSNKAAESDKQSGKPKKMQDAKLMSCSGWTSSLPGIRIATTIETPYANASGKEVNADSARAFGRDVARAIRRFLE